MALILKITHNQILNIFLICGLILVSLWLGAYLYKTLSHIRLKKKLKKRFSYAKKGEKSAEDLLKERGYTLEEMQKSSKLPMWVNGKEYSYLVRPDGFANKEGKKYLIEIKTGQVAINPRHAPTRRQLLEYFHGFSVDGVLLVDAESNEIHDICFKQKEMPSEIFLKQKSPIKLKLTIAFILGLIFALILMQLWQIESV